MTKVRKCLKTVLKLGFRSEYVILLVKASAIH